MGWGTSCSTTGGGHGSTEVPGLLFPAGSVDGLTVIHRESVDLGRLTVVPPPAPPVADLADDQLAAVAHRAGPARIVAPLGRARRRVLTERLRHLMVDRSYERETVLALAYNKKAQEELESRGAEFRPRVRTLNALGYALLAEARGSTPRLLDEREVRRQIEELVPIRRQRANTDPIAPYLEALGQVRLGLWDPEDVESERDDVPGFAAAFGPYREALRRSGAVDFDEQIYGAIEALVGDGAVPAASPDRLPAPARRRVPGSDSGPRPADPAAGHSRASMSSVSGDDDQVIYGHAGADPGFLIDFDRLFPGAGDHPLEVNYRCPAVVVEQAARLLSHNRRRVAKVIRPGPSASPAADGVRVVRPLRRARAPPGWSRPCADGSMSGVGPADIAVLTRVNALLLAPQVALVEAGVPVTSALRRRGPRADGAARRLGLPAHRHRGRRRHRRRAM